MNKASQRMAIGLVACLLLGAGCEGDSGTDSEGTDPIALACKLDQDVLLRLLRGHHPVRSEDVTMVPREPNFVGTFALTSHSGPWDYIQRIPLVFYGPKYVPASGRVSGPAHIVDIYSTVDLLLPDARLQQRDGRSLRDAVAATGKTPKLFVVVVWDGAGRDTLERWPDAWPTLARLEREGTSYVDATVGTSPSVTSAVHASLGTGSWPRAHGVTGNDLRERNGDLTQAFLNNSADAMRLTTFADDVDQIYGNGSRVGMIAWTPWHVGMLGHGTGVEGGDADEMALIEYDDGVQILGNDDFTVPTDLATTASITEEVERVDRRDGSADGRFLGHDISPGAGPSWLTYWSPAWAAYQEELLEAMIDEGAYGRDGTPDFLLVNFKMTDLAGHEWGLESEETAAAVEAQDRALGNLIDHLDATVGDYVVVITADHGAAPLAEDSGAWPIDQRRLIADVDAHFGVEEGTTLAENSSAFGLYLDEEVMKEAETSPEEIAEFLNGYTIADNWRDDDLPEGYEGRGDEQVFSAVITKTQFVAVMRSCLQ